MRTRRVWISITNEVEPPLPGRDVGDVPAPPLVDPGGVRGEVPADRIGAGRGRRIGDRGLLPPPRRPPGQPGLAHQPGDALAGVPVPLAAQLGMDPRGAVPAPGPLVLSCDPGRELRVGAVPARRLLAAGGVVGGTGDLQQLARPLDVTLLRFLRLDERVAVHRVLTRRKPSPASGCPRPRGAGGSPAAAPPAP